MATQEQLDRRFSAGSARLSGFRQFHRSENGPRWNPRKGVPATNLFMHLMTPEVSKARRIPRLPAKSEGSPLRNGTPSVFCFSSLTLHFFFPQSQELHRGVFFESALAAAHNYKTTIHPETSQPTFLQTRGVISARRSSFVKLFHALFSWSNGAADAPRTGPRVRIACFQVHLAGCSTNGCAFFQL